MRMSIYSAWLASAARRVALWAILAALIAGALAPAAQQASAASRPDS